jgi:hypothetical protein
MWTRSSVLSGSDPHDATTLRLTCHLLAFLVVLLHAAAYLTGAAAPGKRVEKGGRPSGVGRCGDTCVHSP